MISIIVPVYNSEGTIDACVKSIIAQDYCDWELLLVDDGSVDNSLALCEEFSKQDYRIHLISQKHQGVSIARNNALERVHGQYVCFVDSDDVVDSNHLSLMYAKRDFDMVICGYSVDEYDSNVLLKQTKHVPVDVCTQNLRKEREILKDLFMAGMIHINCNKLLKIDIIRRNEIRYKEIPVNEDYMFMLEYLMCADSICTVESPTYHWNRIANHETGVSSMPENLLQIYINAHLLTRRFFVDEKVADSTMYYTYYFVALKYLSAIEKGVLSKKDGTDKLNFLMNNKLVLASFDTRKNAAWGEIVMNTLLKWHLFYVFYVINKIMYK